MEGLLTSIGDSALVKLAELTVQISGIFVRTSDADFKMRPLVFWCVLVPMHRGGQAESFRTHRHDLEMPWVSGYPNRHIMRYPEAS